LSELRAEVEEMKIALEIMAASNKHWGQRGSYLAGKLRVF